MENLESRKSMFSDEIKKREENRVRKLKSILVCIGIVLIGIFLIILYYQEKNQKYIDIARNIWYTGISNDYKKIIIEMDNNVQVSQLSEGISSTDYEHIKVRLYMDDNISIVQDKNCISIKNRKIEIVRIKFEQNGNEKIIENYPYIICMIVCISIYIILSIFIVSVYKSTGDRRMVIETRKLEKSIST